jgi:hypothetical protein
MPRLSTAAEIHPSPTANPEWADGTQTEQATELPTRMTVRPISNPLDFRRALEDIEDFEPQSADQGTCSKCVALTANVALVNNGSFSLAFTLRRHVTGTFQPRGDLSNSW